MFLFIELNVLSSRKICRPKMIVWSDATFILRWSCSLLATTNLACEHHSGHNWDEQWSAWSPILGDLVGFDLDHHCCCQSYVLASAKISTDFLDKIVIRYSGIGSCHHNISKIANILCSVVSDVLSDGNYLGDLVGFDRAICLLQSKFHLTLWTRL